MIEPLHDNEIPIDLVLVRDLINSELPQYSHLPLQALASSGSSNLLFRLGEELLVRLPRQAGGAKGISIEKHWTGELRPRLPIEIPDVLTVCKPTRNYPESWSVVGWLDGNTVGNASSAVLLPAQRSQLARDLADVLSALRTVPVTSEAAAAPELKHYRGNSLRSFDQTMRRNVDACRQLAELDLNLDAALSLWERALSLPGADVRCPDCWYHGDLVAENLLVRDGRLSAVLDFGGLGIGDPTIDLHGAWELFNAADRAEFRDRLGVEESDWLRGRAWALAIALSCFPYYWEKMPQRIADRLVMAGATLADDSA